MLKIRYEKISDIILETETEIIRIEFDLLLHSIKQVADYDIKEISIDKVKIEKK